MGKAISLLSQNGFVLFILKKEVLANISVKDKND